MKKITTILGIVAVTTFGIHVPAAIAQVGNLFAGATADAPPVGCSNVPDFTDTCNNVYIVVIQ